MGESRDGMHGDVDGKFHEGGIPDDAGGLRWREAGRGDLVIDLAADAAPGRFHALLARQCRVAVRDASGAAGTAAQFADGVIAMRTQMGVSTCSLIARAATLPLALEVLRREPASVQALVVIAPPPPADPAADAALYAALSAAATPILVLSGTRGVASPAEAGSHVRAHVRNSHYVLVYDAGDAIEADRPEAAASVVADFLARRERFIVANASGLINP